MGWDFFVATKKEVIERAKSRADTIEYYLVDNELYLLVRDKNAGTRIDVVLIEKGEAKNVWGYKRFTEAEHPYYYKCPRTWLDRVPVQCQEWRDAVLARTDSGRGNKLVAH